MNEYIDRKSVEKMIEQAQIISDGENSGYCVDDINIRAIPAADVAPVVHGKVLYRGEEYPYCNYGICSICRSYIPAGNFCTYCGAKMDL